MAVKTDREFAVLVRAQLTQVVLEYWPLYDDDESVVRYKYGNTGSQQNSCI